MRPRFAPLLTASAIVVFAPSAFAQSAADKAQARDLGEQGFVALDCKDYAKAEDLFRRADALYHASTLMLGLARAEAGLGKVVESWEAYHRIVVEGVAAGASAAMRDAVDSAKKEIDGVARRRARVVITVQGPQHPALALDGAAVPEAALGVERPVNPGKHVVHVTAPGYRAVDLDFSIEEGTSGNQSVVMQPESASARPALPPAPTPVPASPAPAPPAPAAVTPAPAPAGDVTPAPSGSHTLAYVALGVGAAGVAAGAVTGFMAMGQRGDLANDPCASGSCPGAQIPAYQDKLDGYHSMASISTIAFAVGGVGLAAGAILLFTSPSSSAKATTGRRGATPYVSLGTIGVAGDF